jgi:hypothetical protein
MNSKLHNTNSRQFAICYCYPRETQKHRKLYQNRKVGIPIKDVMRKSQGFAHIERQSNKTFCLLEKKGNIICMFKRKKKKEGISFT